MGLCPWYGLWPMNLGKARTRGIAPAFVKPVTARQSLAAHQAAEPHRIWRQSLAAHPAAEPLRVQGRLCNSALRCWSRKPMKTNIAACEQDETRIGGVLRFVEGLKERHAG